MTKVTGKTIIDKQIEIIEKILAKKANPTARAISVKKVEAELETLKKQRQQA